jgi:WhiB family redox-sensing transcriptional regulator
MLQIATSSPSSLSMVSISRTCGAYVRATVLARPVVLSLTAIGYVVRFELLTLREPSATQRPLPSHMTAPAGRKPCGRPGRRDSSLSEMGPAAGPISLVPVNSIPRAAAADDRTRVSKGLCRETDPDKMFVRGAAQRKAAVICRHCPVMQECGAEALDNKVEFGIWGGMTERRRRALLREHPEIVSWTDFFDKRNAGSVG